MRRAAFAIAAALAAAAAPAAAQPITDNEAAFSVERFTPPPGAGAFFGAEGPQVLAAGALSVAAAGSLMARPLVLVDLQSGERVTEPVRLRLGYELLAAYGASGRHQLGVALPVVAAQDGDRLRRIGLDEEGLAPLALGDLRLDGKMRLMGAEQDGTGVAIAATLTLPTGDERHFAGEKGPIFGWRLIGGWSGARAAVAANLGLRIRSSEVVLLSPARRHGNELCAAVAAEIAVPGLAGDPLRAVGEYLWTRGDAIGSGRGPSPQEVRLGARWRAGDVSVGAAVGFGTTPAEIGSPAWRVLAVVRRGG